MSEQDKFDPPTRRLPAGMILRLEPGRVKPFADNHSGDGSERSLTPAATPGFLNDQGPMTKREDRNKIPNRLGYGRCGPRGQARIRPKEVCHGIRNRIGREQPSRSKPPAAMEAGTL